MSTARPILLRHDILAALKRDVEIRKHNLARGARIAAQAEIVKVTVETTHCRFWQLARTWVIAAVTSIARESLLPAGSNKVMSPVPAGIPAIGHALRTA